MSEPLRASPVAAIEEAREAARRNGGNFIQALEARLDGSTEQWLEALGEYFRYPTLDMAALERLESVFEQVPLREAMERLCVVLREARTGVALDWHLAHPADLRVFLARHEEGMHALESAVTGHHAAASAGTVEEVSLQTIGEDINPVIRLVNSTIYDAMKAGASDIHLEAHARGMAIKYRIDGVLSVAGEVADPAMAEQVISRIKVLSELDIAERRIPQDGRFKVRVRGREIDFRVSIMPSIFGEDSVIRILDKESLAGAMSSLRLDALGFDPKALAVLRRLAAEPYGMLLVTGPTGSEINTGEEKIVTIEDPVEYQVPGVLQIPVNEKKGLTFARGLRSILRHDPDKIMVGEIRDPETAEIAVQSALTGHLVFTTVHANNVFDVLGRFIHMGVDPFSFVSALNGIVAQRLVRLVCRACAQPITPASDLLEASGIPQGSSYSFLEGRGCGQCRGTGYRGRKAIAEYMVLNDELRELIVARTSIRELKEAAARSGTLSLRQAALAAVAAGQTTLAEVNRVTFVG
ncbi:MAG: type II/IV secretion system protein [Betaproteobacteria bacterium]|nr:type II/IV secretion system protein [Betaproteobacteria bacterium]